MPVDLPRTTRLRAAATALIVAASLTACGGDDGVLRTPEGSVISTSTTRIARVDVVNPDRDYAQTCLAPTTATGAAADISRVVVTSPDLLDAVCALGAGPLVRAVTAPAGSVPAYLGPELAAVPAIGDEPSAAQVSEAAPQLVLSTAGTGKELAALRATGSLGSAEVVEIGTGKDWRTTFTEVAAALGRTEAAQQRLTEFDDATTRIGRSTDASHTEVSLVRFTPEATLVEGTSSFGASILKQVGAQRPVPQRRADPITVTGADYGDAEGDLIYVSADGEGGLERGKKVLESDEWLDLGAAGWNRVLWVNDTLWYETSGLAAAWLVLRDIRNSLNSSSGG